MPDFIVDIVEVTPIAGDRTSQALSGNWGQDQIEEENYQVTGDIDVESYEIVYSGRVAHVFLIVHGSGDGTLTLPTKLYQSVALSARNCEAWIESDSENEGLIKIENLNESGIISGTYILIEE